MACEFPHPACPQSVVLDLPSLAAFSRTVVRRGFTDKTAHSVMADDTGMIDLMSSHHVADTPADAMQQWFNAGGMVQFYDWPLYQYLNATLDLVANGTVPEETLRSHVRHLLGVKWDLGLFEDPYIPDEIDPYAITEEHRPLALEAAHKSIVLLENKHETLPLRFSAGSSEKIALVGPFIDTMVSFSKIREPIADDSELRGLQWTLGPVSSP